MSIFSNWMKLCTVKHVLKKHVAVVSCPISQNRSYADKAKQDLNKTKHIQIQGTENEERMRVRRTRPADVPCVLRFVRENARAAWPNLASPTASSLVLCDYVARALSQGHSMLAEQQESRRGWSQIRGLALCLAVCPWDANMLDRWANCIRCSRSKRFIQFTAHCLRAPSLHDKYHVHNMLQVIVVVPQNSNTKNSEIIQLLAKNVIQRGRDMGFSMIRFDVTNDEVAKVLDELKLKKECQVGYKAHGETIKQHQFELSDPVYESGKPHSEYNEKHSKTDAKSITVYTAFLNNIFDRQ